MRGTMTKVAQERDTYRRGMGRGGADRANGGGGQKKNGLRVDSDAQGKGRKTLARLERDYWVKLGRP